MSMERKKRDWDRVVDFWLGDKTILNRFNLIHYEH